MFVLVPLIVDRLRGALGADWNVASGLQPHDRRPMQRATVFMRAPDVASTSGPGVSLTPSYVVQLAAKPGEITFEQIDAAFDAVIGCLHNWRPGACKVGRLQLQAARDMEAIEQELFGYELLFSAVTKRMGCDE